MNRIYSTFICHQNNTRNGEFRIFRNSFVSSLTNLFIKLGLVSLVEETTRELILLKKKDYKLKKIRPMYPITYLECLKLIRRRTDTSGRKEIIFTTSQGLLNIDEIQEKKIGGTPLFMINYL